MKLMSLKQYMNMSKPALIRKITKTLRAMPKKRLAVLCYNITKSKLPRLRTTKQKKLWSKEERGTAAQAAKKKRKFSRKQLAAQRLFAKRAREGTLRKSTRERRVMRGRFY